MFLEVLSTEQGRVSCELPDCVALIIVTPESSLSERFKLLVEFLKRITILDRIIFDECHMYLECTPELRGRMGATGNYYNEDFGIQRIYLTATLPLILEDDCNLFPLAFYHNPFDLQKNSRRDNTRPVLKQMDLLNFHCEANGYASSIITNNIPAKVRSHWWENWIFIGRHLRNLSILQRIED